MFGLLCVCCGGHNLLSVISQNLSVNDGIQSFGRFQFFGEDFSPLEVSGPLEDFGPLENFSHHNHPANKEKLNQNFDMNSANEARYIVHRH